MSPVKKDEETLREKISIQSDAIQSIKNDVQSIVAALSGDKFGNEGFIEKFRKHENKTNEIEKMLTGHLAEHTNKEFYKKGQVAVYAAIGAGITFFLGSLPKIISAIGAFLHLK